MQALHVIASERRLHILELVWDRELAAGDIAAAFDVTWAAVSQHLRVLKDAGFVTERRDGVRRLYRADPPALGSLRAVVEEPCRDSLTRLKVAAEAEAASTAPSARRRRTTTSGGK